MTEFDTAFYLPLGDGRFSSTEHTAGPWSRDAQHFGPPSALLVRALEELPSERATILARVTVEILGPAPLAEVTVRAEVQRPGRSVELLTAELSAGGRAVARASAWRLAIGDTADVAMAAQAPSTSPEDCPVARWPESWSYGYLEAMEWRAISGSALEPGPAAVWTRQRIPLVDGEKPSPLQRLFAAADSGSGISSQLDWAGWLFINSELTVHVLREPVGEWICLDGATAIGPHGVGTARTTIHDLNGQVAAGAQALLVKRVDAPR